MGAIGGLIGVGGGAGGTGFAGPGYADIQRGTNPEQLNTAYEQNQKALAQQQALLQALQGQNGIQNQSNVYNQLQGVVAGTGPNPAQAMLNNATGQNVANQAALMAGQRGAGANAGLIARQAAQQGGALQQNAVGQGAALQAQQALGALGQAGNLATGMVGQQMGQTNANTAAQQAEQQILQNANTAANNAAVGMQSNINQVGGQLAGQTMQGQQKLLGGGLNALGGAAGLFAQGGAVEPQSHFGRFLNGKSFKAGGPVPGKAQEKGNSLKNDTVPALLSPGEVVIPRDVMNSKDPAKGAAEFVQAVLAKKRAGK